MHIKDKCILLLCLFRYLSHWYMCFLSLEPCTYVILILYHVQMYTRYLNLEPCTSTILIFIQHICISFMDTEHDIHCNRSNTLIQMDKNNHVIDTCISVTWRKNISKKNINILLYNKNKMYNVPSDSWIKFHWKHSSKCKKVYEL